MKRNILLGAIALLAGSVLAADSTPKAAVKSAAQKLAQASNYSWKTTVTVPEGSRFRPGPTEGKAEKNGFTMITMTFGNNTMEAVLKGGKGALKTQGEWQSLSEAAEEQGPGRFMARRFENYKGPAAEAESLVADTKDLTLSDGVYSGDLTEQGAKQLMTFRRGGGGGGPEISNAKGSAKFWVKDGQLTKYEYKVEGTMTFNGQERDLERTTTVDISDVGTTKVNVPEEAAKKAS